MDDLFLCEYTLDAAEIRAGNAQPIDLVSAQGVNQLSVPVGLINWTFMAGTTAFSAAANLQIGTPNSATLWLNTAVPLDVLQHAFRGVCPGMASAGVLLTEINQPLRASFSANTTDGDGILLLNFSYRVITIPYPW